MEMCVKPLRFISLTHKNNMQHTCTICTHTHTHTHSRVDPVNINSNPALLMHNLPNKTSLGQGGVAGALTAAMSRWCVAMRTNRVEPDFIDRKTPTHGCMEEYKYLFGETRIPRKGQDDIIIDNAARHIVVLRGPHVYAMEVIDRSGAVASAAAISGRFNRLILDTAASASASVPLIGTLTSQERNWYVCPSSQAHSNLNVVELCRQAHSLQKTCGFL